MLIVVVRATALLVVSQSSHGSDVTASGVEQQPIPGVDHRDSQSDLLRLSQGCLGDAGRAPALRGLQVR